MCVCVFFYVNVNFFTTDIVRIYFTSFQPIVCCFKVNIVVVSGELAFEPSFDKFKELFCHILDAICDAVKTFEKLETQLYLDWAGPQEFIKVPILKYGETHLNLHLILSYVVQKIIVVLYKRISLFFFIKINIFFSDSS